MGVQKGRKEVSTKRKWIRLQINRISRMINNTRLLIRAQEKPQAKPIKNSFKKHTPHIYQALLSKYKCALNHSLKNKHQ